MGYNFRKHKSNPESYNSYASINNNKDQNVGFTGSTYSRKTDFKCCTKELIRSTYDYKGGRKGNPEKITVHCLQL